jgi:hypothetical protein
MQKPHNSCSHIAKAATWLQQYLAGLPWRGRTFCSPTFTPALALQFHGRDKNFVGVPDFVRKPSADQIFLGASIFAKVTEGNNPNIPLLP